MKAGLTAHESLRHNPAGLNARRQNTFAMLIIKRIYIISILCFALNAPGAAQGKKPDFGPVVAAYLSGLTEEQSELEFQWRQRLQVSCKLILKNALR